MAQIAFKEANKEAKHFKTTSAPPAGFNTGEVVKSSYFFPNNIGVFTETTLSFPIPENFVNFTNEEYETWLKEVKEVWDVEGFAHDNGMFN